MAENNNNRMVMILAGTVVVLLVAFVAVVMLTLNGNNAGTTNNNTAQGSSANGASTVTSSGGFVASQGAFDPATATKVPANEDPKAYMTRFFQDILSGKWAEAEKMQPAASVTGDVASFQNTWKSYGITAFSIFSSTASSTDATVVVRLDLGGNGIWSTTWTFAKPGATWLVKQRAKIAIGEPTK